MNVDFSRTMPLTEIAEKLSHALSLIAAQQQSSTIGKKLIHSALKESSPANELVRQ